MRRLRLGEPLHPAVSSLEEGVHYNYTPGGHSLTLSVRNPDESEIRAVRRGEPQFAVDAIEEAIFVLFRFGDHPWQIAHYNWWINPPVMRPDPVADLARLNGGLSINVGLVGATNGIVEALRVVRLPHEYGSRLLQTVELQIRRPFDPWKYLEVVEKTRTEYLAGHRIVAEALCVCTADENIHHCLTHGMTNVVH